MATEALPLNMSVSGGFWRKMEGMPYVNERKGLSFMYIGLNEELYPAFTNHFHSGYFVKDSQHALQVLNGLQRDMLPDTILVDIPLNKLEFKYFHGKLIEKNISFRTIIIYNENKINAEKIRFLQKNELIDDVVDIFSAEINYKDKIQFLKRVKIRQAELSISMDIEEDVETSSPSFSSLLKRGIDILAASAIILLLLPIFILVALAILTESKGPVFYTSKRAGRGFRVFKFYKFRTMEIDADKKIEIVSHLNQYNSGEGKTNFLKINNDPRVTKFGRFLRKTSLDELPQLFNVIKGDMSLVGNRPLPIYEADTLTTNDFVERFMAPAGITGLWQIKKRGNERMSAEERINLDISYARKANFAYDLWIMAKTPTALFQKSNA